MFSFPSRKKTPEASEVAPVTAKLAEPHPLDALTGGAFSAATSGERASRVRDWLASNPSTEKIQEVFKELSVRDKGAARPLREKLDEIKRAKGQEAIAVEWVAKAQNLLASGKFNIADGLAWQRDAAKAGAPLSKEPLMELKLQIAERVKGIEDLQHRVQVQREAAVLLAQRIEVLSTKSWRDALNVMDVLRVDVQHWQAQAQVLTQDALWPSVDGKFPPLLDASQSQLLLVWDALQAALEQTVKAAADASAVLPSVPVWAEEIRMSRPGAVAEAAKPVKAQVDPALREKAQSVVREYLKKLIQETSNGRGKASANAAVALRTVLKEHGKFIDAGLEHDVHSALIAAGELEGWQRWSADQVREELVTKAEALLKRPENDVFGGRKMQDVLRSLREQWKTTDQGGMPNHALWKRFDEACNEAYKVVEAWLEKIRAEAAEAKAQRLALIEELKTWGQAHANVADWKLIHRTLFQFGDKWRAAGHLSEKAFAELQPLWKQAINAAAAPLETAQKLSIEKRHAMIEEARLLGTSLRMDAVKALQQRWQAEAQSVPLDRKFEQKLWDAFRQPIDEAFQRKTAERENFTAAMSAHDQAVLVASKALEAANAASDASQIHQALAALDVALQGNSTSDLPAVSAQAAVDANAAPVVAENPEQDVATPAAPVDASEVPEEVAPEAQLSEPVEKAKPVVAKPVIAVRGDDRPGMKKDVVPVAGNRNTRPGDRKEFSRDGGRSGAAAEGQGRNERGNFKEMRPAAPRSPRLGDAAFRAQREAREQAQIALRKLAAQAQGEVLTQLTEAWKARNEAQFPAVQELGSALNQAVRSSWLQALARPAKGTPDNLMLRLEIAADVPTPADFLSARRMLQLQLLTKRNEASPEQTWKQDVAAILETNYTAECARRLQSVLRALLKR